MPQTIFDDPDGTLAMLRDSVAGLAVRHPGSATLRARRASGSDLDVSVWAAMAEAGWTGLLLPEEIGGTGLGLAEQAVLSEALGRALISEPLAMSTVFAGVLLARAPQGAERDRLAAGLADGSAIIASAWQNAPAYSRVANAAATASANGFVITGEKHFVEAATSATDFLVVAETPEGAALFSVPPGASGVTVETRDGIDGASIGCIAFANCQVPSDCLLARAPSVDALLAAPILHARLAIAAELAGIACRALEITVAYTKDRVQFGKPIASFQAIQHRLVEMWSDAEFACASVVNAVEKCASGNAQAGELAVLAAKARAGDAAYSICRRAVHLHGAMGFTDESDIGLYLKRAINLNFTLGQPEALRLQFVELERAA